MSDDELQKTVQPPPEELERLERLERLKTTPGFDKALELIRNLSEYDDFSADFLEKFPLKLPRKFPLKLGNAVIGQAQVDWKPVIGQMRRTARLLRPLHKKTFSFQFSFAIRGHVKHVPCRRILFPYASMNLIRCAVNSVLGCCLRRV